LSSKNLVRVACEAPAIEFSAEQGQQQNWSGVTLAIWTEDSNSQFDKKQKQRRQAHAVQAILWLVNFPDEKQSTSNTPL
jgi:hypothetical protein